MTPAFRDGDVLVVALGSNLPTSCVKCGAPSVVSVNKTFRWSPLYVPLLNYVPLPKKESPSWRPILSETSRLAHQNEHRRDGAAAWGVTGEFHSGFY